MVFLSAAIDRWLTGNDCCAGRAASRRAAMADEAIPFADEEGAGSSAATLGGSCDGSVSSCGTGSLLGPSSSSDGSSLHDADADACLDHPFRFVSFRFTRKVWPSYGFPERPPKNGCSVASSVSSFDVSSFFSYIPLCLLYLVSFLFFMSN